MRGDMKIQKFIAMAGVCSRRKAEELIRQGRVFVDGRPAKIGERIVPGKNRIEVDGREVKLPQKKVYIMLNKPAGIVTSTRSQFGEKTVLELLGEVKERVFPVGRLDKETEGLLILTNDGELAYRITHPSFGVKKTYFVKTDREVPEQTLESMRKGTFIDDKKVVPDLLQRLGRRKYRIILHEGMKRVVRRLFLSYGFRVVYLRREAIGALRLGRLSKGKWRYLSQRDLEKIFQEPYYPSLERE